MMKDQNLYLPTLTNVKHHYQNYASSLTLNKKCVIKVQSNNFKHSLQVNSFDLPKPVFEI